MKHTFSLMFGTALLAFSSISFAQDAKVACKPHAFNLGARGAANASMLYAGENEINNGYSFDASYSVGLTGSYAINNHFAIVAEAGYFRLSTVRDGLQPLLSPSASGTTYFADFRKKEILNYIEVPVMARISTGNKLKAFVNAGPYVGFLTAASIRTSGQSLLYKDVEGQLPEETSTKVDFSAAKDVTSSLATVNFGVAGGLGASYSYKSHTITVDARYNLGLTNIRSNEAVNGRNNLQTMSLGLGYSYLLFE